MAPVPTQVAPPAADPTGEWLVAEAVARIRIVDCNGSLWGVVSWEARPGVDSKNPNPDQRSRPTLGMPVLLGMTQTEPNQWGGHIYNSEDGRTYSANISLTNANTLRVQGCVLRILCGGENWSRVQASDAQAPGTPATQSPPRPRSPGRTRAAPAAPPDPATEICLRVDGSPGLSHERGLK